MLIVPLLLFILSFMNPAFNLSASAAARNSPDWQLTVYYTAVESFHHGKSVWVRACTEMGCDHKSTIGKYPSDFIRAVQSEGTGRITSGEYAGKYLCWSKRDGYWLDKEPKNAQNGALVPWVSAAADVSVMDFGTGFRVLDCGKDDTDASNIDPVTCYRLKNSQWKINDRFEPGLGGSHHLDLYIGEEDQEDFVKESPKVISVKSAVISIDQP